MSGAVVCDACGVAVVLDHYGRHDEDYFWTRIGPRDGELRDACSVSCAEQLLVKIQAEHEAALTVSEDDV